MANDIATILLVAGDVIVAAILLYAAYWALTIRRALSGRIYRAQALWIAVFCPVMIPYVIRGLFPNDSSNPFIELGIVSYYILFIISLFFWIASSVRVSRFSDPFLRHTFRWNRLRLVVWGIMGSAIALIYAYIIGTSFLSLTIPQQFFFSLQGVVYIPPLAFGGSAILTAGIRSRDSVLRRALKWFGLFLVAFLVPGLAYFVSIVVTGTGLPDFIIAVSGFVYIPAAYCLYRSAKSLVPLNRLPLSGDD